jgi:dTDP-4-amino-4,6-dideoxygalactose transaminase
MIKIFLARRLRKNIQIAQPPIGREEIEAVVGVLRDKTLTDETGSGTYVRKFEESFARFIGVKYAVAINSGTAALHASLIASDVGSGDEVIVPSFTFTATAEAVALTGAKPVFVDINPKTYCIDPQLIREAVTSKTRAIIPVHVYGLMADMEAIIEIAEEKDLIVIEDACQAHGAELKGRKAGSYGDLACFSFYASKIITTGEGGMVTTNRRDYAETIQSIRRHGMGRYEASERLGHNYRMTEIAAALGYYQLQKISKLLDTRRRNAQQLTSLLESIGRLELPEEPENYRHAWYLYTVRLRGGRVGERNKLVSKLVASGIQARVYYGTPVHMSPYYRRTFGTRPRTLPKTETAARQVFSLPCHQGLSEDDINYIAQKLKRFIK